MTSFSDTFGCRHPLICAAMNQVSDARLAIAVHEAGAFPSLAVANYIQHNRFDQVRYVKELRSFKSATHSEALLLSAGGTTLLSDVVVAPFLELGFKHFEVFHWDHEKRFWPRILERVKSLQRDHGATVIFKVGTDVAGEDIPYPTIILKGPEGAGRAHEDALPLQSAFEHLSKQLPHTQIIASGGISQPHQVTDYLSRGALGVAVGTLFAASVESAIDWNVKQKIVAAHVKDLKRCGENRLRGIYSGVLPGDTANLTRSLSAGVKGLKSGALFLGEGVEQVTDILPVREIVRRLMGAKLNSAPAKDL